MRNIIIATTTLLSSLSVASAHAENTSSRDVTVLDRVMVIGNPDNALDIAGSAQYVDTNTAETSNYRDINRVLRQVPGVNLQEEEGYGNRPNIGMRGARSERSANVTLMEDGVLIAPAPYAAPSAYYFPKLEHMEGVEIRKGSSTIKFGPRTTSGVVNFISRHIPSEKGGEMSITGGDDNTGRFHGYYGQSTDQIGFVIDYSHAQTDGFKKLDNGADTGYRIDDIMGKIRINTSPDADIYQSLELKLGYTDEDSDETYLGLTDEDFAATPFRRYAGSQVDNLKSDHQQYQLRHFIELSEKLDVTTTLYKNDFYRNWYKLQSVTAGGSKLSISSIFDDTTTAASHLAILKGADSGTDTLQVRANQRNYESYGIDSVVGYQTKIGSSEHQFEIGVRYHEDEEDRFQHEDDYVMISGTMGLSSPGAAGSNANRIGSADALAFFIQDEIGLGNWTFTPGFRYENIDLKRKDYGTSDPSRSGSSLTISKRSVSSFVPGLGVGYSLNDNVHLFGGVHKGFAPPAPPSSSSTDVDIEESVNYEAGVRYSRNALFAELVGFYNDYDNLLGTDTLSSGGGGGTGDQFNAGEVEVLGLEASINYDFAEIWKNNKGLHFPARLAYTFTSAEFQNSFDSDFDEWGSVTKGDDLPYIPEHQLYVSAGVAADKWMINASGKFMDSMRTVAGSGSIPVSEKTDAHIVIDLNSEYELQDNVRAFVAVENLFDEEYIAARRPAGARPGQPRTILAGMKVAF